MALPARWIAERFAPGSLAGLALFWLVASVCVRGGGVPDWLLPVALVGGWLLPVPRYAEPPSAGPAVPRWLPWSVLLVLTVVTLAVGYGAVATPSRQWDGAAAFDAKVTWLVAAPTLQQPFFADPGVFHHSPDYPLLQPLLVAGVERLLGHGCGRLVFPGLFVLLLALVGSTLRSAAVGARLRWCVVLAVGVTPALIGPGGGAVDSGYGELLLLVATTAMASALLLRNGWTLALAIVVAIASKPEGAVYAGLAWLVAFGCGDRRLLWSASAGICAGLLAWLPVQRCLLHRPPDGGPAQLALVAAAVLVATAVALGLDALARRTPAPHRLRWGFGLGAPLFAVGCLPWLAGYLPPGNSAFGVYLAQSARLWERLPNLPPYAVALLEHGIARWHFGATFVLPVAAAIVLRVRRVALPDRATTAFVGLGMLTTAIPFLLSPEPDLQHHLRSSLPRLLLHWLGPAWLLSARWADAVLSPTSDCAAPPPGRS